MKGTTKALKPPLMHTRGPGLTLNHFRTGESRTPIRAADRTAVPCRAVEAGQSQGVLQGKQFPNE